MRGQRVEQHGAARVIAGAHAAQVTVELAALEEVAQRELGDDVPAARPDRQRGRERPRQPGRREHPAEPQPRREALGQRADQDDPLGREPLQRPALTVVVVLDDQAVAVRRPRDERRPPLGAQRHARRELRRGRHDDDRHVAELVHPQTLRVDADRPHPQPRLLDHQPRRMPPGVLDRDLARSPARTATGRPARTRARKPRHDDDVLGVGRGAAGPGEIAGERLAQGGDAARVGLAQRVERRRPPGPRSERSQASRGNDVRSGPGRRS